MSHKLKATIPANHYYISTKFASQTLQDVQKIVSTELTISECEICHIHSPVDIIEFCQCCTAIPQVGANMDKININKTHVDWSVKQYHTCTNFAQILLTNHVVMKATKSNMTSRDVNVLLACVVGALAFDLHMAAAIVNLFKISQTSGHRMTSPPPPQNRR